MKTSAFDDHAALRQFGDPDLLAGSDVGAIDTTARHDGDGWRLTGDKWFCSNPDAGLAMVLAQPEGGEAGTRVLARGRQDVQPGVAQGNGGDGQAVAHPLRQHHARNRAAQHHIDHPHAAGEGLSVGQYTDAQAIAFAGGVIAQIPRFGQRRGQPAQRGPGQARARRDLTVRQQAPVGHECLKHVERAGGTMASAPRQRKDPG